MRGPPVPVVLIAAGVEDIVGAVADSVAAAEDAEDADETSFNLKPIW